MLPEAQLAPPRWFKQLHAVLEVLLKSAQVQRPRVMILRGATGPGNP